MSESRFFEPPSAMTIGEIVALTGAQANAGTDLIRSVTEHRPARPGRRRRSDVHGKRKVSRRAQVDARPLPA